MEVFYIRRRENDLSCDGWRFHTVGDILGKYIRGIRFKQNAIFNENNSSDLEKPVLSIGNEAQCEERKCPL